MTLKKFPNISTSKTGFEGCTFCSHGQSANCSIISTLSFLLLALQSKKKPLVGDKQSVFSA